MALAYAEDDTCKASLCPVATELSHTHMSKTWTRRSFTKTTSISLLHLKDEDESVMYDFLLDEAFLE